MNGSGYYITLPSRFGPFSLFWRELEDCARVYRIFLPVADVSSGDRVRGVYSDAAPCGHPAVAELGQRLQCMLEGEIVAFDLDMEPIALETCSEFQQSVLRAEHAIPRGWVSTYGKIAAHLGLSRGARAVGGALAHNPFPLVVPCHRAVRADGTLGGYQGGSAMKRALLEMEGVEVSATDSVHAAQIFY